MPAEKQNNISGKLDAMHHLPEGYNFRPEAVWNRLAPQLKKTAINYRAVFFAAASFIAVVIFISLPTAKNEDGRKAVSQAVKHQENSTVKLEDVSVPSITNRISKSAKHVFPKIKSQKPVPGVITQPAEQLVIKEEPRPVVEMKEKPSIAVALTTKRRFPVAHINELNNPVIVEKDESITKTKTVFPLKKHSFEIASSPVINMEEQFTERKKPKGIFPLLNSSQ